MTSQEKAGNIVTLIDAYDHLDRLTEATATGGSLPPYTESYRYDEIGNITHRNGNAYTYAPYQPHAVTQVATNTYRYDDNGNMTDRVEGGVTYTQTWNFENKLKQVAWNGETVRFVYDGDGNRLLKIEQPAGSPQKTTLYLGRHYEVEVGSAITPTKYYFHEATRVAMQHTGQVYYLHGDHLGSTSLTTDQNGAVVNHKRFRPYGLDYWHDGPSPTAFGFTNQRYEQSFGLYDYNARYYDPYLGRFISPDPIVPDPVNSQNFNRYAYVNNNPVRYTDPSGHCGPVCWTILALTVGYTAYDYLSQPDIAYAPNDAMATSDLPPSDLPGNEDALFAPYSAIQDGNWPVAVGMAVVESTPLDEIPGFNKGIQKLFRKAGLNDTDVNTLGYWAKRGKVDLNKAADQANFFAQRNVRIEGHALSQIQIRGFSPESVLDLYSGEGIHRSVFRTRDGNYLIVPGNKGHVTMGVITTPDGGIKTVLDEGGVQSAIKNQQSPWISPLDDDYPDWLK